jgi:hypothetical protein
VALGVQEDVAERVPHLFRRRQNVMVITLGEHPPRVLGHAVHGPRQARANGFHSPAERVAIGCFDDHVCVITLQRIVNQPESRTFATGRERALNLAYHRVRTEQFDVGAHP